MTAYTGPPPVPVLDLVKPEVRRLLKYKRYADRYAAISYHRAERGRSSAPGNLSPRRVDGAAALSEYSDTTWLMLAYYEVSGRDPRIAWRSPRTKKSIKVNPWVNHNAAWQYLQQEVDRGVPLALSLVLDLRKKGVFPTKHNQPNQGS